LRRALATHKRSPVSGGNSKVIRRSALLLAPLLGVVAWSWLARGLDPSAPGLEAGPYPVRTIERVVLHDEVRRKDVPVKIYYPDAPGPFPVIVFSHGALASKDAYAGLGAYWASFGYVSVHPSHGDSIADRGFHGTLHEAIRDPRVLENRPRDVSFVLDALAHAARFAPALVGRLDLGHVGVAGHSFGAYTAAVIGGTTVHLSGRPGPVRLADPRTTAVVLLSPQGPGRMGLTEDSWKELRLPVLLVYGSRDFGPYGEPPAWRNAAFRRAPPGDKYDLELEGATHMQCAAGRAQEKSTRDRLFQCIAHETLAFWDAYLKQSPDGRRRLTSHELRGCSADAARFASK
jgi:predicted dienelactone hydrolase